jgi:putative DNA primase/helicase
MQDDNPKPAIGPPAWDNIPRELAERPQWLLWRYELPEGKKKWQKVPYYIAGGRRTGDQGSDRDRQRLQVLEVVRRAYERDRERWAGVGFAFLPDDGLVGIDLDEAIDSDGVVNDRHEAIIRSCPGTFCEISPSGRGAHVIALGQTHTAKSDDIGVEFYCGSQFFTVTGRLWPGTSAGLAPVLPMTVDGLHAMIEKAKEARRAAKAAEQPPRPPRAGSSPRSVSSGGDAFRLVNAEAMRNFDAWVPVILPGAKPYKGGYRVSSKDLGRDLQEDLALHPDGIRDFGEEEGMTPIDVVMRWLPASKPADALAWLAGRVGVELGPRSTPRAAAGGGMGPPSPPPEPPPEDSFAPPDESDPEIVEIRLLTGKGGKPEDCRENVLYCLRDDPELKGLVAHNLFTELQDKTRTPPWGGEPGEWTEEDDLMLGEYLARTHGLLIRGAGTLRAGVQMTARENKYHPIVESLRALKWDRISRLETWLIDCLGAEDRPYARLVSKFFVMGMVARLLRPGCKFDYMLILQGDQGLGKSTAFKILADPYFMDTPFKIGDKDSYLSLQGVWLVEFSELEAMSKSESTAIKAFVTSTDDRFRPPYGSRMVKMPRRAVLAGTTNSDQFLKDATGERRFWPIHVTAIRQDLLRACRDQLFAEAIHLVEHEDAELRRYYPTRDEERELFHPEQDRWRMSDVWTDILADYLNRDFLKPEEDGVETPPSLRGFFTAQELFQKALYIKPERMDNAKLMQTRVSNAMRELGFAAAREPGGARKRGYLRPGWEFAGGGKLRPIPKPAPQAHSSGPGGGDALPI